MGLLKIISPRSCCGWLLLGSQKCKKCKCQNLHISYANQLHPWEVSIFIVRCPPFLKTSVSSAQVIFMPASKYALQVLDVFIAGYGKHMEVVLHGKWSINFNKRMVKQLWKFYRSCWCAPLTGQIRGSWKSLWELKFYVQSLEFMICI